MMNRLLRKDAMELRELVLSGKDPMPGNRKCWLKFIRLNALPFGQPVQTFDFAYRDKDKVYHEDRNLTPQVLPKVRRYVLRDYVPVIHEPTPDKPLHRLIQFHGIENMSDSDMKASTCPRKLEELCIKQLKAGQAVWFACDAGAFGARKDGVWDPDSIQYEALLVVFDGYAQGERLQYGSSSATHAMLLTGVHFDADGKADR